MGSADDGQTLTSDGVPPIADEGAGVDTLPEVGDVLANKYRIERLIGRGGMGAVYAAQHELLRERVVLKVVLEHIDGEQGRARFMNEARASFQIRSEHVARVLDVDFLDSGSPFMVLEYLEGEDLARVLRRRGTLEPATAVDYVLEALDALASAHGLGIVHRDLKPANLFVTATPDGRGRIKVLDFGIAKTSNGAGVDMTGQGAILGTPQYMSPEQLRSSRSVDARTDIWAIGVILYEVLAGRRPFQGEDGGAVFAAVLEQEPVPLLTLRPTLPPALADVVHRCLRKNVGERYSDVAQLARALAPFASSVTPSMLGRIEDAVRRSEPRLTGDPSDPSRGPATAAAAPPILDAPTGAAAWGSDRERGRTRRPLVPVVVALGVGLTLFAVSATYLTLRPRTAEPPIAATAPPADPTALPSPPASTSAVAAASETAAPTPAPRPSASTAPAPSVRRTPSKTRPSRPAPEYDPTSSRRF